MTMKELMRLSSDDLTRLSGEMALRGNGVACVAIDIVKEFGHKRVRVIKGRKVPKGTEGEVFWLGSYCRSPYGDPWGIYTTYRCGIKDDKGEVYWTSVDNIEVIENEE